MKLIVGLGNPGRGYAGNRHNIGFISLNYFARKYGIEFNHKQALARVGKGEIAGQRVMLARPQTFMNASGESVSRLVKSLKIGPEDLLVIHDDLDLPLGRIRIRAGGSAGGHKGIQSIIDKFGTRDFVRLKVGVGRPQNGEPADEDDVIDYVLSDFSDDEKITIAATVPLVSDAILAILTEGPVAAMNKFN